MKRVAVIILNWNGQKLLESYLPSLCRFTNLDLATLYVADNGSTDGSIAFLEESYPTVEHILFDHNWGFAEGYNRAIEAVGEEYVVLLNSDVEVTAAWLEPLVEYMDGSPQTAACQPKIRALRSPKDFEHAGAAGGYLDRWGYPFCRGRLFDQLEEDSGQYNSVVPIFWATGAALFTRRACYLEVGGLDASFFAHMEEIDLCWRLHSRGYEIVAIPSSTLYHLGGATLGKESPHKTYLNFRNNLLMLYKNLPKGECFKVLAVRLLLDLLAAVKMAVSGERANGWAVIRAIKDFYTLKNNYQSLRNENLKLSVGRVETVRYPGSVVVDFYLRGKKLFSQLPFEPTYQNPTRKD